MNLRTIKLTFLLGAALAAPSSLVFATQALSSAPSTPPQIEVSLLRKQSRQSDAWIAMRTKDHIDRELANYEEILSQAPEEQQTGIKEVILAQAHKQFTKTPQQIEAAGLLASPTNPAEKHYSFLAKHLPQLQALFSSTSLGSEAIITLLENPSERRALEYFIAQFSKVPHRVDHFLQLIAALDDACHKFITPAIAMNLQCAKLLDESQKQNNQKNYNAFSYRSANALKKGITYSSSFGLYGTVGICSFIGWPTLSWLLPSMLVSTASLSKQILLNFSASLAPIRMTSGIIAATTRFNPLAPDVMRETLLAATKLAPFLHPLGLPKTINEKSPLTVETVHQLLRIFRYIGTLDVAARIVKLKEENLVIPCSVAPANNLEKGIQNLWHVSVAPSEGSPKIAPLQGHGLQIFNGEHNEQEHFDKFICNLILSQAFGHVINYTGSEKPLAMPALKTMNFTAIHYYVETADLEKMHCVQVCA